MAKTITEEQPAPRASAARSSGELSRLSHRFLTLFVSAVVLLLLWSLLARSTSTSLLPFPGTVWSRFTQMLHDGTYWPALLTTLQEAALGWLVATLLALPLGYVIGRQRALEDALAPYIAGSQAMPVVALAPLLFIWLGFELLPKVVVCALIAFFPILASTGSGIRSVPQDFRDAARVFGANSVAVARLVDIPFALRQIFTGMKIGAALSVTGAVVSEFVNCQQGLGCLVNSGIQTFDTPLEFVGLISLFALGALAYFAMGLVENLIIRWE